MQASRFGHSLLNVTTSFLKIFIVGIIGFIATPIIVEKIGEESFGHYRLLSDWMAFIALAEFGIGGGVLVLFSRIVREKKEKIVELFQTVFGVYVRLIPVYFLTAFILFLILKFIVTDNTSNEFSYSFWLMVCAYLFIPFTTYRAYLEASQRTSIVNVFSTFQMLSLNIFAILFAYLHWGLLGQSLALFLSISGFYLVMAYFGCREFSFGLWKVNRNLDSERKIWSHGRDNFYISSALNSGLLIDTAVITWFYSAKEVVPFYVSGRLGNLLIQKIQGAAVSLWASLADLWHSNEKEKFNKNFLSSYKLITIFSISLLFPLVIVNEEFVTLWMGEQNALGLDFVLALSCFAWSGAINVLWRHVLGACGHLNALVKPYILSGVINLVLTIFFTWSFGFSGPLWGSATAMVFLILWKINYFTKVYGLSAIIWIKDLLSSLIIALVLWIPSLYLPINQSWIGVGIGYFAYCMAFLAAGYLFLFTSTERNEWKERFIRLVRSKVKKT